MNAATVVQPAAAPLIATGFEHRRDKNPQTFAFDSFKELVDALLPHDFRPRGTTDARGNDSGKEGRLFSPAEYRPGAKRGNAGVVRLHFGMLDFDDVTAEEFAAVREAIGPYEHAIFSTWQHDKAQAMDPPCGRYRVMIRFTHPVLADEWPGFWLRMSAKFGGTVGDASCKDPARMYYLPSAPEGTEGTEFFDYKPGAALDVDAVLAEVPAPTLKAKRKARTTKGTRHDEAKRLMVAQRKAGAATAEELVAVVRAEPDLAAIEEEPGRAGELERLAGWVLENIDADGRTEIEIVTDEHVVNDAAVAALANDPDLYQRGGMLVRIESGDGGRKVRGIESPPDTPRIVRLPDASLREALTRRARFVRVKVADGVPTTTPAHPPDWVVRAVAARGTWDGIRHLAGVVETPVLRPDGTILDSPGYDEATGLVYRPTARFQPVPNKPTAAQVKAAVDALRDVVRDFPFESEGHEAAWLGALLTPLARHAFDGPAPLFLMDANVRGAGKTLLVETIGLIVTGRPMALMGNAREEEMAKRITALVLEGAPLIVIDNVADTLGCPSLDRALTGERWKDRILGATETTADLPLWATWYATGNNVVLGADTIRRVAWIRLASPEERPEERAGLRDLRRHVRRHRAELVAAALTILRGFFAARAPDQGFRPWGSFEGWSRVVRGALVWAACGDPGSTRTQLAEQGDTEADLLRRLLDQIETLDPKGEGITTNEILTRAVDARSGLRALLSELTGARAEALPSAKALGKRIGAFRDRVVGGRMLVSTTRRAKEKAWRVRGPEAGEGGSR
ncbi:MAG TPA: hypothetical protein VN033_12340 [Vulgatibacter sp.]|nr:hypothetical protein [Vulgatibacter sp.]